MAEYISFQPSDYFATKLYTGNGSTQSITLGGTNNLSPSLVWIKNRDAADSHNLIDTVRGTSKVWASDSAAVQETSITNGVTSFDSDGFSLGTRDSVNTNTEDFVSWNWKMGTTSGLTGGSITPTGYSLNTTAGQSIIAYTGTGSAATIPHGLGKVPEMIIIKALDLGHDGIVYHEAIGNTYYLKIGTNQAKENSYGAAAWNNTSPTTTVFSEGGNTHLGGSSNTYIAYCFTSIKGYSKFGSYTGNGSSTDGPFIYTGFRPSCIMFKKTNAVGEWVLYDTKRLGYNGANSYLEPSTTDDDDGNDQMDFLANGVKIRNPGSYSNTSAGSYIYAAFSEFPIVSSNDIPGTAR